MRHLLCNRSGARVLVILKNMQKAQGAPEALSKFFLGQVEKGK